MAVRSKTGREMALVASLPTAGSSCAGKVAKI
jgi:hypothetical protein